MSPSKKQDRPAVKTGNQKSARSSKGKSAVSKTPAPSVIAAPTPPSRLASPKRSRSVWISVALLAVIALVTLEVSFLMRNKVERQRHITQVGTFGVRGEQAIPEAFKGTFLEKIDKRGRFYHIDEFWNKVLVYDGESGTFLLAIDKQNANKEVFQPQDVDSDSRDQLYILDYAGKEVMVFSSAGELLRHWATPGAESLAVDAEDNILVSDVIQKEIVRYSPEGQELQRFGRKQSRQKIVKPWRLVVDNQGMIYLMDQGRQGVLVYDAKGNFKRHWSLKFKCNNNTGMAEQNGLIYINDFEGHLIWIFSTAGKVQWQIKRNYPGTVAVDSEGRLYLAVSDGIGRFTLEE